MVIGGDGYYEYGTGPLHTKAALSPSGSIKRTRSGDKENDAVAFSSTVRRSVSDGGAFWRFKRGAKDWDYEPDAQPLLLQEEETQLIIPRRSIEPAASIHNPASDADTDDWDVETAIQQRVVQVMFTVPRERLRVVNADPDAMSEVSVGGCDQARPVDEARLIDVSLDD